MTHAVHEQKHTTIFRFLPCDVFGSLCVQFVANARAVKDSLALLLDQDAATVAAQASSPEAWLVNHQLGSIAPLLSTLTTRLQQGGPSLASAVAVDAPNSTTEAAAASGAAHTKPQAAVASGPSYRLIHRSGNPPPVNQGHQGPARRRLSRDELANVFGHLQPWELTRHRRRLGTSLFHQSAANYTHLVIDLEGHGSGRAAIADEKRREREGGEGTADAAAVAQDDDDPRSADEGTLEVLSLEEVDLDDSIVIPYPPPSRALSPAPAAPIHLPALKTVRNIAHDCLLARVGRQWRTPAVKALITRDNWAASGLRAWLAEAIEVLDLNGRDAYISAADEELDLNGRRAGLTADALSGLPADGNPADIDELREVMVARGVSRSIRELEIDMGWMRSTTFTVELCQSVARLIDAIAHPEAVEKGVFELSNDGTCGEIHAELLSRSSTGPAAAQKLIRDFAKRAGTVAYSGLDEAVPAAISDDTFPAAHTLKLMGDDALANGANKKRALEIASNMPSLSCVKAGDEEHEVELDAPAGEVWRFLERLQAALVSRGKERNLSVQWYLGTGAFVPLEPVHNKSSPCLWDRGIGQLPPIDEVRISVHGGVADDALDELYNSVMAMVSSFNHKLKVRPRED
ncbi:unnamed protein product [Vitrella brassicaformis CCMP3155]|uniref:Uncharacterized protein n=1 Tax=Vitrella brassicaformis (strain CCMP3155) TaxID=1169540 RepID=A0A0G4FKL7_VITBC|nr:unnamed protein product [Vitrella brassicaformis CCMP3155]|eukprot:CEM14136.1 unnamed protein product [Vitrella brassicaformis CCMP3155]